MEKRQKIRGRQVPRGRCSRDSENAQLFVFGTSLTPSIFERRKERVRFQASKGPIFEAPKRSECVRNRYRSVHKL